MWQDLSIRLVKESGSEVMIFKFSEKKSQPFEELEDQCPTQRK